MRSSIGGWVLNNLRVPGQREYQHREHRRLDGQRNVLRAIRFGILIVLACYDFKEKPGCVRTLALPIASVERQLQLTFSHLIFSFEPGLITSFQGDAIRSVTLARFLRPFSLYGGILSSQTSGTDRPLPGAFPSF